MKPVPVLLVTHPGLGSGLKDAAAAIFGNVDGVDVLSNQGLTPQALEDAIGNWVDGHPGSALVLADLNFGSCCTSARRATRNRPDVGIVSGVNLAMVLAALRSREHESMAALVDHVRERARVEVQGYLNGDVR